MVIFKIVEGTAQKPFMVQKLANNLQKHETLEKPNETLRVLIVRFNRSFEHIR